MSRFYLLHIIFLAYLSVLCLCEVRARHVRNISILTHGNTPKVIEKKVSRSSACAHWKIASWSLVVWWCVCVLCANAGPLRYAWLFVSDTSNCSVVDFNSCAYIIKTFVLVHPYVYALIRERLLYWRPGCACGCARKCRMNVQYLYLHTMRK